MAKIAVILVNYNDSRFLINWIEKMTAQNPDEIIIVDDGSTDNSRVLIASMQKKHPQIKLIPNTNAKGPYGAFISGCQATEAEYVSCWSCDDEPRAGYFAKMSEAVNLYPFAKIFTCNAWVEREGFPYERELLPFDAYISPDYLVKICKAGYARGINFIGSVVEKRLVLYCWGAGGYALKVNFDAIYAFLGMFSTGFVNLSERLVKYRSYANSFGASGNYEHIKQSIEIGKMIYRQFPAIYDRAIASGIWSKKSQWAQQIALKGIGLLPGLFRYLFYNWFYSYNSGIEKL